MHNCDYITIFVLEIVPNNLFNLLNFMKFNSLFVRFGRVKSKEFPPVQVCIDLDDFHTLMKCVDALVINPSLRDVRVDLGDLILVILNKFKDD